MWNLKFKSQLVTNRAKIVDINSSLLILLFTYAALNKILHFETFEVQLGKSPILSYYVSPLAILVPASEILISLLLIFKRLQYVALCASFAIMVMFTTYIWIILNLSDYIPCSCGGILESMNWTQHLYFNILFVIICGISIVICPNQKLIRMRGKAEALKPRQ